MANRRRDAGRARFAQGAGARADQPPGDRGRQGQHVKMKVLGLAALLALGGCLPFGLGGKSQPKPPPPVETVETTQKRADSLFNAGSAHFRAGNWKKAATALDRGLLIM